MTKKKRNLIFILTAVLVVLFGGYYTVKNVNEKLEAEEEAAETETVIEVASMNPADMISFSYYYQNELLVFKKEEEWLCEGYEEITLDQDQVESMLSSYETIFAVRHVTDDAENLSEYGLDEPQNVISFETKDGTRTVIVIGNQNGTTGDYYLMLESSSDIYTVSSGVLTAVNYSPEDLEVEEEVSEDSDAEE